MAIVRCNTNFHLIGRPVMVRAGQLFDSSDPIVVGREHLFDEVSTLVEGARPAPVVEQATAAPGELRHVGHPEKAAAKKAAAKKAAAKKAAAIQRTVTPEV